MDLDNLPPFVAQMLGYVQPGIDLAKGWLLSPAAWSQFAVLVVAYVVAVLLTRTLVPKLSALLTPPQDSQNLFSKARRFVLLFLPLLLPLAAFVLTGIGEQATRSIFGSGEVIAFGKRVFMFIAARVFVRDILQIPFLKLLGKYILIPVAALYAVGLLDNASTLLEETRVQVGNIGFSLMSIVRGVIAGSLLFWLGGWSNQQSADYITKQDMRPSLRTCLLYTSPSPRD